MLVPAHSSARQFSDTRTSGSRSRRSHSLEIAAFLQAISDCHYAQPSNTTGGPTCLCAAVEMEVAGLAVGAIALVPPTLQLIDFCTIFYNEVQHFGRSTQQYNLKFTHLRGRYDSLQRVLFEKGKFPFAPDTLFRSLPEKTNELSMPCCRSWLDFSTSIT